MLTTIVLVFAISAVAFALFFAFMAVGVMMGRKPISGSCGGLNSGGQPGEGASCSLCSNPSAACQELKNRMSGQEDTTNSSWQADPDCQKDCEAEGCTSEQITACKGP